MSNSTQYFRFPGTFEMHRGGVLEQPVIAYETWGELNSNRDNAILIFTGLSPSAHATSSPEDPSAGWWEEIVGPSRSIDTRKYFVVCVNSLGSCFGSTGPATDNPATGKPYGLQFPVLTLEDIAVAGKGVIDSLGIDSLYAVVGPSMGGMTALAFAAQYPALARSLVLISTATRSLPHAIALRSLQREMIRRDPAWLGGEYGLGPGPIAGMRLARKLGMITYRSGKEWEMRFGRERIPEERPAGDPFAVDFEIEAYLEHHAQKFTGQFDANCYLYLSRASDLFDLAEHGGSIGIALGRIETDRILIIGVRSDSLFNIDQQRELAAGFEAAGKPVSLIELDSIQGHDSFLVDMDRFRPVLSAFFAGDWAALAASRDSLRAS
ncbi:MAG: homoserine O-acetyltransferase [Gammaproteobacteria bacterium]|nr:MAG: homoserine O-acetyltransferase [Gammaproteobacteria bacterium]